MRLAESRLIHGDRSGSRHRGRFCSGRGGRLGRRRAGGGSQVLSRLRNVPSTRWPSGARLVGQDDQAPERERHSVGSGVIIDAAKGYILTNHHVIDKADEITVTLKDRRQFKAKLVGSDRETDIALLRIPAENLTALPLGNSDQLQVGDYVVAIGNPFGLGQTVTSGIVSALGRSGLGIEGYEDFIQTDASINPGNSGGALVNLKGELVGVNTAIVGPSGGNVGIGFAVPSNMARSVWTQLLSDGEVKRGKLGIMVTHDLDSLYAICDRIAVLGPLDSDLPSAWRSVCAYHMDHMVVAMRGLPRLSLPLRRHSRRSMFSSTRPSAT